MAERDGVRENGSGKRNLLEATRPAARDENPLMRAGRNRGATMDEGEKPQAIPKGLAKQFALVFLGGVGVGAVCIIAGFLLGYNARPSKTSAVEGSPPAVVSPYSGTRIPAPPTQAALTATSASSVAPATVTSSGGAKGSIQAEASPASGSTTPEPQKGAPAEPVSASSNQPASRPSTTERVATAPARPAPPVETTGFLVQVGSHHSKNETGRLAHVLTALGYNVLPASRDAVAGAESYRVQTGPYASRELADQAAQKLELEGFQPFVFPLPEAAGPGPENRASSKSANGPVSPAANPKNSRPAAKLQPALSQPLKRQPAKNQLGKETARGANPSTESAGASAASLPASPLAVLTPPLPPPPARDPGASVIVVQIMASTQDEIAEDVRALKRHGFPAFVGPPRAGEKTYRAFAGPFESLTQAQEVRKRLASTGWKPFIRVRPSSQIDRKSSAGK